MSIITFLKSQRKKRLSRRLEELKEDSAHCLSMSKRFLACAESLGKSPGSYWLPHFYPYSSFWDWKMMTYCVDPYASFYNEYMRFLFMHNRAEAKIENLEKKLEEL